VFFIDTNVLVYAAVEQGTDKKERAIALLKQTIASNELKISTLVLQEYAFTLAKLNMDSSIILKDISFIVSFQKRFLKKYFCQQLIFAHK
jgi:predicted nucleic acid-binding protein